MAITVGIVGFQGDVEEHVSMLKEAARRLNIDLEIINVRKREQLSAIQGLIVPGGESTTIYKLLRLYGLYDDIKRMAGSGMPVMGTCAGLILISKNTNDDRVKGMGLLDVEIERNVYGRQIDSFIDEISIKGLGDYSAVFIRAPGISDSGSAEVVASHNGKPVMVRNGNILGLTFHPELTKDTRIHEYFLKIVEGEGYTSSGK